MIPLKNDNPVFSIPFVTWLIIGANVLVFLWMRNGGEAEFNRRIFEYAAIPRNVLGKDITVLMTRDGDPVAAIVPGLDRMVGYREDIDPDRIFPYGGRYIYRGIPLEPVTQKISPWLTLLTSMFMHASWLHLIGNMWFLKVFGTSLEDSLGKLAYLVFYFLCGFGAIAAQLAHDPGSVTPFLGASGAIAGVMGAFAVRFPGAQVLTLVPIILYTIAHLPAWVFMLIYIGEQIFMSVVHSEQNGGVAWWAHIGGFGVGYLIVRFFPVTPPWREIYRRTKNSSFA